MPESCTCGAQLPPDARFCHKCGKPQREETAFVEEPAIEAPSPKPSEDVAGPPAPPEIGFRNSVAVRVSLLAGSFAFLGMTLPFPALLRMILLLGAGAFAVFLYRRRSGYPVEIRGGARMGWITGLFCFVMFTVLFTISFAALAVIMRDGGMVAHIKEQLGSMGMSEANVQQALEVFQNPAQFVSMLLWVFLTSTFVPALGGALGAKLLGKN